MYNQLAVPKEMVFMPLADHSGKHDQYYGRNNTWIGAIRTVARCRRSSGLTPVESVRPA